MSMADPDMLTRAEANKMIDDAVSNAMKRFVSTGTTGVTAGMDALTGVVSNNSNVLEKLTSATRLLPSALTGGGGKLAGFMTAVDSASKLFGAIAGQATESANSIFSMYSNGVVMSMDNLSSSANSFGLSIDEVTKLMVKHARVVSTMGIDRTTALGEAFRKQTRDGTALGMSLDQANETILTFTEILNNTGRIQNYNNDQIIEGATKFAQALNAAAQASGKNVAQIRAEVSSRIAQNDSSYLMAGMNAEQFATTENSIASLKAFNTEFGNSGDLLTNFMLQFKSTNNISGIKDQTFRTMLAMTGTTGLFAQASMEKDPEKQRALYVQMADIMRTFAAHNSALQAASGPVGDAVNMMGSFIRDITDKNAKDGGDGKAKPIDDTAATIKAMSQDLAISANIINNSFNDLAVAGAKSIQSSLEGVAADALDIATAFGAGSRTLLKQATDGHGIEAAVLAAATGAVLSMGSLITSATNKMPVSASAAAAGGVAAVADEATLIGRTMKVLRGFGLGYVIDSVGKTASAAGFDRTGAALQAGSEIYMGKIGGGIVGGILGSFTGRPEAGAKIGSAIGMGIESYLNMGNIKTVIVGPGPADTAIDTANAAELPANPTDALSADLANKKDGTVNDIVQQLTIERDQAKKQSDALQEQMNSVLQQLTILNTNITDQTAALKIAFSKGNGNVYP